MCIRDRVIAYAVLNALLCTDKRCVHFCFDSFVCIITLIPVSYTHLDVYKRQLRCFQRLSVPYVAAQPCHWHDNWCTRGTSIPVLSYYCLLYTSFTKQFVCKHYYIFSISHYIILILLIKQFFNSLCNCRQSTALRFFCFIMKI